MNTNIQDNDNKYLDIHTSTVVSLLADLSTHPFSPMISTALAYSRAAIYMSLQRRRYQHCHTFLSPIFMFIILLPPPFPPSSLPSLPLPSLVPSLPHHAACGSLVVRAQSACLVMSSFTFFWLLPPRKSLARSN